MLSIVLAGLVLSPFAGQTGIATYASMRGTVTTGYPSYKPVPNAQVVVSGDVDRRETRTDANGRYAFLTLLPGIYHVYVPSVRGTVLHATSGLAFNPSAPSRSQQQCYQDANAAVELSAGLAYFANFDLLTRCV